MPWRSESTFPLPCFPSFGSFHLECRSVCRSKLFPDLIYQFISLPGSLNTYLAFIHHSKTVPLIMSLLSNIGSRNWVQRLPILHLSQLSSFIKFHPQMSHLFHFDNSYPFLCHGSAVPLPVCVLLLSFRWSCNSKGQQKCSYSCHKCVFFSLSSYFPRFLHLNTISEDEVPCSIFTHLFSLISFFHSSFWE